MSNGIVKEVKKIGSHFAFEFFLEIWKPKMIDMLRKWLSSYSKEELQKMVRRGNFPNTSDLDFGTVQQYYEYLEKISAERLFEEYLAPARPDLAQALQEMGMPGAKWLIKLRQHLLDQVKRARAPVKQDLVQATCDNCGKSWPVKRSEFESIKECPFCGHGKDQEAQGEKAS